MTAALSPRMALSQSEFVGTIHYDALNKGKHIDMVVTTDGVRLRYDVVPADSIRQGYGFTRIVDGAKRELTVLTPNTRHYRVFPLRPADSLTVQRPDDLTMRRLADDL